MQWPKWLLNRRLPAKRTPADALAATAIVEEERFRTLAEKLPLVTYVASLDSGEPPLYIGPQIENMIGVSPEEYTSKRRAWVDLLHPADREEALAQELERRDAVGPFTSEYRWITEDGRTLWIRDESLMLRDERGAPVSLQGFMLDITAQKKAEARQAAQHAVAVALAESSSLSEAGPRVLAAVCDALACPFGALWRIDAGARTIRPVELWTAPDVDLDAFVNETRSRTFELGEGLPGQVWESGEPCWIPLIGDASNFPRAWVGSEVGLRSALAFPIEADGNVCGLIELFSHHTEEPETELMQMLRVVAGQIGQFVERTKAEDRLREREALLAEAERITDIGSWRWDILEDTLLWSDGLRRIFGVRQDQFGSDYEAFLTLLHPDDRERVNGMNQRALVTGEPFTYDYRIVRRDGEVRVLQAAGEVVLDDGGRPVRTIGTVHDITTQVRSKRELAKAEARYRELVERIPLATYVDRLDEKSTNLFISPQIEEMLGYSPEEWADPELFRKILHPDDVGAIPKHDTLEVGDTSRVEYRVFARDGRVVWLRDGFVVVQDDPEEDPHIEGFLADVTQRKRAEEQLRESEERFRAMLESAAVGIILLDTRRRILISNRSFEEMLGYSKDELAGMQLAQITHPDDEDLSEEMIVASRAGSDIGSFEKRYVTKDGSPVWVHISPTPVRGESGDVEYVISVIEDITERRRLEEELRHAQKMEAVGRVAGGVAHDFNNLLLAIRGYCELAAADAGVDPEETRRDIQQIKIASETAAALTSQLLAFSRKQILHPRLVDLSALVAGRESLLERVLNESVQLETELATGLNTVRVDEIQMEQALVNVVVNARDAIPDRGQVRIETANAQVDGKRDDLAIPAGSYVRLSVSDTGSGMDDSTRAQAFDPFFTTKGPRGTGLGLATVQGFVEQSGGYVSIRCVPDEGTTIDFYFPTVEGPVVPDRPQDLDDVGTAGSETVLLVEDDDTVREVLRQTLEREGYDVLVAADGEEALIVAELHEGELHAVVTDVVMPRMGGVELAQNLRSARPAAQVVYMSGHLQDLAAREEVQEHGEFLQKPFAPKALAGKLRELLDGRPVAAG